MLITIVSVAALVLVAVIAASIVAAGLRWLNSGHGAPDVALAVNLETERTCREWSALLSAGGQLLVGITVAAPLAGLAIAAPLAAFSEIVALSAASVAIGAGAGAFAWSLRCSLTREVERQIATVERFAEDFSLSISRVAGRGSSAQPNLPPAIFSAESERATP